MLPHATYHIVGPKDWLGASARPTMGDPFVDDQVVSRESREEPMLERLRARGQEERSPGGSKLPRVHLQGCRQLPK